MKVKIEGRGNFNPELDWSSSNSKVAKIEEDNIKLISTGDAKITVTSRQDKNKKDTVQLSVLAPEITTIKLNTGNFKLNLDEDNNHRLLSATLQGKGNFNSSVRWFSDDDSVATVDSNGLVVAKAEGTTKITAISIADPNKNAEVQVTVDKGYDPEISKDVIAVGVAISIGTAVGVGAIAAGVTVAPVVIVGVLATTVVWYWLKSNS